jgi:large subunit ribosomal protein L24
MSRRFGALYDKWKILRGDKVKIIAGKDKGVTGTIARVLRDQNRVIVEGFNLVRAGSRAAPLLHGRAR